MSESPKSNDSRLSGTTLRVYRYLYRSGKPLGIREIQRGLALSSPSVAEYHVKKLLAMSLVKQEGGGTDKDDGSTSTRFTVDRIVFENMVRVKRVLIPLQVAYVVFFSLALFLLVFLFRPTILTGQYLFSIIVVAAACVVFGYQTINSFRSSSV